MVHVWRRFGVALFSTVGLALVGLIYQEVFTQLYGHATGGQFSSPVVWLDQLIPMIVVTLLVTVWGWTIYGAVTRQRAVERRRVQ